MLKRLLGRLGPSLQTWSTIVANVTIVVTLVIAWWTYQQAIEGQKVEESLKYVSAFNEEDMLNARNAVFRMWKNFDFGEAALSESAVDAIVERMVADHDKNGPEKDIRTAIVNITTFIDSVEICRSSGVCEQDILASQIGPYAKSFRCLFGKEIGREQGRLRLPTLGAGLFAFTDGLGAC